MDNYTHLPILHSIPFFLLLQDALNCSSLFRESLELTALQFLVIWIPLRITLCTYRVSAHPQLTHVLHKSLRNTIRSCENPQQPMFLNFLLACIMVNTISLVILFSSFVFIILSPLIQYVANAPNPQSDPRIHHSDSDVILTCAESRSIKSPLIVPLRLFYLSIPNQSIASDPLSWNS